MNNIVDLIEDIRQGKMVILVDDENRENEGDLILAADGVTPESINFMATEARGLICLSLPNEQIKRLGIPMMISDEDNFSPNNTAFTISIEAANGVTTGISAADRAQTVQVAVDPNSKPSDIIMPGHIFPIRSQVGGVLKRAGHTEASIDLTKLAGKTPGAVICEIMNPDGSMSRVKDLKLFAKKHDIKIGTIEDLIKYRVESESFIERVGSELFLSEGGVEYDQTVFRNKINGDQHLTFSKGDLKAEDLVVRVHRQSVLNDVFNSNIDQKNINIKQAFSFLDKKPNAVFVYLNNEKDLMSSNQQGTAGSTTLSPAQKDYGVGAQILRSMGLSKVTLLSNHSSKRVGLKGFGIEVLGTISLAGQLDNSPQEAEVGL